jgi:hypothetical protein
VGDHFDRDVPGVLLRGVAIPVGNELVDQFVANGARLIASAVKGGNSSCLYGLWCSGSEVIGGDGIGSGRTSRTMTRRDEKCVLSLAMARTSSYRVGR